ncbi:MAG: 7-cyano-7-deazaguanine synthase QueC [Clostridiales bacterium]|nr:7-cyano-7-deazaguanine synthase QueC [Clostridiales bacterium]
MPKPEKAVVLFSGGIDSTTALYWAMANYAKVTALSFDYGQRHRVEISLGRRLTRRLRLPHVIMKVDLRQVGGSALTDQAISIPRFKRVKEIGKRIPLTYVPFRNGIFLSLAAAWAEANNIRPIVCGFNTIDSPHYPDTRASFVRAMERAINSGTRAAAGSQRIKIIAPFLRMKKSAIIKKGLSLGAEYSYSISCYRGQEIPCRHCSSCLLRRKAWAEAGFRDHLLVRLEKEGKI